jgi:hypothetical protein
MGYDELADGIGPLDGGRPAPDNPGVKYTAGTDKTTSKSLGDCDMGDLSEGYAPCDPDHGYKAEGASIVPSDAYREPGGFLGRPHGWDR